MDETAKAMVGMVTGLLAVAWTMYMTYLLYNLVDATALMWFMYWTYIPMIVIFQVISAFTKRA